MTKEQALLNITQALLFARAAFQLYLDNGTTDALYNQYIRADTKAATLKDAYADVGLVTWRDILALPTYTIAQVKAD